MWWAFLAVASAAPEVMLGTDYRYTFFSYRYPFGADVHETVNRSYYVHRQRPTWFQTTRASVEIADRWYVGALVRADADWRRLRQLAGQLGLSGVLLELETGRNPGQIQVLNDRLQVAEYAPPDPDDVVSGQADFWLRRSSIFLREGGEGYEVLRRGGVNLGVSWLAYGHPTLLTPGDDYRQAVVDANTRFDVVGLAFKLDTFDGLMQADGYFTCKGGRACIRLAATSGVTLGVGRVRPSEDAFRRLDLEPTTRYGFGFGGPTSLGVAAAYNGRKVGLGVRAGVDANLMSVMTPLRHWYTTSLDDAWEGWWGPFAGAAARF